MISGKKIFWEVARYEQLGTYLRGRSFRRTICVSNKAHRCPDIHRRHYQLRQNSERDPQPAAQFRCLICHHNDRLLWTTQGLPKDFPGLKQLNTLRFATPEQRVLYLENEFAKNINNNRFIPFLTLHEFETFVLVDPDQLEEALPQYPSRAAQLKKQIGNTPPEEINDGSATHPAARIIAFFPEYKKALHGPLIAQRIGLPTLRKACPHFHQWLQTLEQRCTRQ